MNRKEQIEICLARRKELLEQRNKIDKEYEMLGEYAKELLKQEEQERKGRNEI